MASPAQIAANCANAQKSTGPRTVEGKQKASMSALQHGLSSARVVLAGESQEEWNSLLGGFTAKFQPVGEIEGELVFEMAACLWRLRRASTLETLLLNTEIEKLQNEPETRLGADASLAVAFTNLVARGGPLAKLHTHESRLRRRYEKAMAEFESLRAAAADDALPEIPASQIRQNEPELVDLRSALPELSNTGVIDKLLKLPRIDAVLNPPNSVEQRDVASGLRHLTQMLHGPCA